MNIGISEPEIIGQALLFRLQPTDRLWNEYAARKRMLPSDLHQF